LDQGADVELFCQECGQRRTGDRWRWAFALGNELRCPRCARATEHHRAQHCHSSRLCVFDRHWC
jgi:hypothetical protein